MAAKLARLSRVRMESGGHAALRVGDLLAGKYRVQRILGEGGMGMVVAAHHELLHQDVAVKLLYRDGADREAITRLLLEARAAARLQSDHVARVLDVDTDDAGLPFIVMELLQGADLCEVADTRGALPRWLVVDVVLQALDGLAHAHARGIVHRDLKPSNLFLANRPDGSQIVKILDFGISKSVEKVETGRRAAQLTGGLSVLGSPPYMSPEQVRTPKDVDHRTDIWSLGVVMYELLTNSMPFGGATQETFAQILEKEPAPIRTVVNGVPEGLEVVVRRCLSKKREERYDNVAELARALSPFGSGRCAKIPDRVAATLANRRDEPSGTHVYVAPSARPPRVSVRPESNPRLDSVRPELAGIATTLTTLDAKKKWFALAVAVPAFIGIVVGATALVVRARRPAELEIPSSSGSLVTPAKPASAPVPPLTPAIEPPSPDDSAALATDPPPPADSSDPLSASSARRLPPLPASGRTPGTRRPPPASTKPVLPPGLPRSRD